MLNGWKERAAENISPLAGTHPWVPGDMSSPGIRASACLLYHAPKASSAWSTTQHRWESKEASRSSPASEGWQDPSPGSATCLGMLREGMWQKGPAYKTSSQTTSRR